MPLVITSKQYSQLEAPYLQAPSYHATSLKLSEAEDRLAVCIALTNLLSAAPKHAQTLTEITSTSWQQPDDYHTSM